MAASRIRVRGLVSPPPSGQMQEEICRLPLEMPLVIISKPAHAFQRETKNLITC